jgi:hypothetical protein
MNNELKFNRGLQYLAKNASFDYYNYNFYYDYQYYCYSKTGSRRRYK